MSQMTEEELTALLDNPNTSLEELVDASVRVFGLLNEAIQDPTSERSQRLLNMVNQLKELLEKKAKDALNQAGMSEEDLKEFLDNPNNFSPAEWEQLQSMRQEMTDATRQFMSTAMESAPNLGKLGHEPQPKAPKEEKGDDKKKIIDRKEWLDV